MKEKCKYVFVILTYRNTVDIVELFESIKKEADDYKAIVVNSFYDDETKLSIQSTALKYGAHFINVENKGYGYGNNRGIEFALNYYEFDWLIIANPDTVIKKFDFSGLVSNEPSIIAPEIRNLKNKRQNPMKKSVSRLGIKAQLKGFKTNSKFLIYTGIVLSKLKNSLTVSRRAKWNKKVKLIDTAHGSFVIFSSSALSILGTPYDEKVFLFAEEGILAQTSQRAGIKTYYYDGISVLHKEDGSMKFRTDLSEQLAKSNIYAYENYFCSDSKTSNPSETRK